MKAPILDEFDDGKAPRRRPIGRPKGKPNDDHFRQTHCHLGHDLTLKKDGRSRCRICANKSKKKWRARERLKNAL
jgi:hypothetical protein